MATRLSGSELQSNQALLSKMLVAFIKTYERLEMNICHIQTGQCAYFQGSSSSSGKETYKHYIWNENEEEKTKQNKQKICKELSFLWRKPALGWRSGDGARSTWVPFCFRSIYLLIWFCQQCCFLRCVFSPLSQTKKEIVSNLQCTFRVSVLALLPRGHF